MSKPTTLLAFLLLAVAGALFAAPANAASTKAIIKDCSSSDTGLLKGTYSKADLRAAQKAVRGDVAEYTGCYDAIAAALRLRARTPAADGGNGSSGDGGSGAGGSGSSGSSGGGTSGGFGGGTTGGSGDGRDGGFDSGGATTDGGSGTSGSDGTTDAAAAAAAAPVTQQAGSDKPVQLAGTEIVPGFGDSGDGSSRALPTPLIVFLVLFAAGAVGIGASTIGRRVLARRRA